MAVPTSMNGTAPQTATKRRFAAAGWLLRGWKPTFAQGRRLLATWLVGSLAFALTLLVAPGITVTQWWAVPITVLIVAFIGAVVRPILLALAVPLSWVGVILLGFFAQAVIMFVAIEITPEITQHSFWSVFWASWIYAFVNAIVSFVATANEDEAFIAHCLRLASHRHRRPIDPEQDGVVFIQMDGMSMPMLRWGITSGTLPVLSHWVRSGTHTAEEWTVRVPSTTPVSQAGFLHGTNDDMPAFRWYERDSGRLLVANRSADAATIESRLTSGRGLLADGGTSIGNIFSGDAPTSFVTMSKVARGSKGRGSTSAYALFFVNPYGFTRGFLLSIGEIVKEWYQARRQRRLDFEPRVHRPASYALLRAATNVLMRDLQTSLLIDQMMAGAKSIFVDFLDYDEVAHHAGPFRAESIRSLQGVDHVVGLLSRVAEHAPRRYHFVIVSDHGQSQGATFRQRYGETLEQLVHRLMGGARHVVASTSTVEDYGPANALVHGISGEATTAGRATRRALRGRGGTDAATVGAASEQQLSERTDLVVCGSGNLGLVWFAQHPERLTLDRIDALWPGLVASLAAHPGISFAVVMTADRGPVAIGANGRHYLDDGVVEGTDPLTLFGPQAALDMRRCARFSNAPDIYLNSLYDRSLDEVGAFEELVGCHGGLGGAQTHGVLVHPSEWRCEELPLVGADAVHRQLVQWLEQLGHRRQLTEQAPRPSELAAAGNLPHRG